MIVNTAGSGGEQEQSGKRAGIKAAERRRSSSKVQTLQMGVAENTELAWSSHIFDCPRTDGPATLPDPVSGPHPCEDPIMEMLSVGRSHRAPLSQSSPRRCTEIPVDCPERQ